MSRSWNTEPLARNRLNHLAGVRFQGSGVRHPDAVEREVPLAGFGFQLDRGPGRAEMDGRSEADAAIGVRAVVDRDVVPGARQVSVRHLRPRFPPVGQILFAPGPVPVLGIPLCRAGLLARRRVDHLDPLWPETRLAQGSERQHDMDVRVAGLVVQHPIHHLTAAGEALAHELPRQGDLLIPRQLDRQGDVACGRRSKP